MTTFLCCYSVNMFKVMPPTRTRIEMNPEQGYIQRLLLKLNIVLKGMFCKVPMMVALENEGRILRS